MRRIAASILALLVSVSPLLAIPNPLRLLSSISVLQTDGRNMCSVTSINNDKKYYLTAAHCVIADWPTGQAMPRGDHGEEFLQDGGFRANEFLSIDGLPAFLVDANILGDMAILVVPGANRPSLKLSEKGVRYLDNVYVAGHPFGWDDPTVFRGSVAAPSIKFTNDFPYNKNYMLLQVTVAPGNSGSSIVNDDMKVVGVLQIGWGRSFSPVAGASPYVELVAFAKKYFSR